MLNISKLLLSFFVLNLAQSGMASKPSPGVKYLAETRDISKEDAQVLFERIKPLSKKYSFLNCPLELIERQWGGTESVEVGMSYLDEFIEKIKTQENLNDVENRCNSDLKNYRKLNKKGEVVSRAINEEEMEKIQNSFGTKQIKNHSIIAEMLRKSINQDTVCFTKRYALKVGYIVSGSIGITFMQCGTPLGRRFNLRGPSVGGGMGSGITLSLPLSSSHTDDLSYRIRLFEHQEQKYWKNGNVAFDAVLGGGISREVDRLNLRPVPYSENLKRDHKLTLGFGLITEKYKSLMTKKDITPLYWFLDGMIN